MIGYVFIRSGAIHTLRPGLYPARQAQILSLVAASQSIGERLDRIVIEKSPTVTGLRSLPKLMLELMRAHRDGDRVFVDDFRRILLACPIEGRMELLKDFVAVGDMLWELRAGWRSFGSLKRDDLAQLLHVRSNDVSAPRETRVENRTAASRIRQTSQARAVSARIRAGKADRSAGMLRTLRDEMIEIQPSVTLETIATEATKRGLKTSRGNPWSASSVHRALKRCEKQPDAPDQ